MRFENACGPGYALCVCHLERGEAVSAERGAMVTRDAHVRVEASAARGAGLGGALAGIGRRALLGEAPRRDTFRAAQGPGAVTFAPSLPGELLVHELRGGELIARQGSCLAAAPTVELEAGWGGFATLFGEGRLRWIRAFGDGPLALAACGAVREIEVDGGFIASAGHVLAFEPALSLSVRRIGAWLPALLSPAGLVCRFAGRGRLFVQTRDPDALGRRIGRRLPARAG